MHPPIAPERCGSRWRASGFHRYFARDACHSFGDADFQYCAKRDDIMPREINAGAPAMPIPGAGGRSHRLAGEGLRRRPGEMSTRAGINRMSVSMLICRAEASRRCFCTAAVWRDRPKPSLPAETGSKARAMPSRCSS